MLEITLQNNLLCSKVLEASYCPNKSLWDGVWKNKKILGFEKVFRTALKLIKSNISWIIGSSEKISIWNCNWILVKAFENLSPLFFNPNASIKEFWNSNKRWNVSKVRSYFSDNKDVEEILKIYIPRMDCEDKKI